MTTVSTVSARQVGLPSRVALLLVSALLLQTPDGRAWPSVENTPFDPGTWDPENTPFDPDTWLDPIENSGYETNKFELKDQVEGSGPGRWEVAWADDVTETDALHGVVAAGVSVAAENPGPFLAWVDYLVDRTVNSLWADARRRFPPALRAEVRNLAARAIAEAVQGRRPTAVFREFDTFDFKAGAIRYSGRNYVAGQTVSRTWGMKPYVAFRIRGSGGGSPGQVAQPPPPPSPQRFELIVQNPTTFPIHYACSAVDFQPGATMPGRSGRFVDDQRRMALRFDCSNRPGFQGIEVQVDAGRYYWFWDRDGFHRLQRFE